MEEEQTLPADITADEQFRRYVTPEIPVLLRVARRLTGSPQDAEDAVQETLIRAYRAIERFDGRHPRAWLLTILRHAVSNMYRRKRPQLADSPEALLQLPAAGPEGRNGTEERVLDGVVEIEITQALFALGQSFREVVVLVDVDGLSYQEAADVLDVPPVRLNCAAELGRCCVGVRRPPSSRCCCDRRTTFAPPLTPVAPLPPMRSDARSRRRLLGHSPSR